MTDLRDIQLDKWDGSLTPEPGRAGRRVAIVVVGLALLAAGGYFAWSYYRARAKPADVRVHTEQAVTSSAPAKPVAEAAEDITLPPLDQTDAIVRELVARLSSHPKVAAWLATDQLLRNFTVVVFNVANGRTPVQFLTRLRPGEKFQVSNAAGGPVIDPRSYRRYDAYADALGALDARGTARLYATLKPRLQESYQELGNRDGNIDQALERAIRELLATPVVDGTVSLASTRVSYDFADPRLQSLSSAQRQLLRMGPRNMRIVQAKLREIAPLLGFTVDVH
jgi:hypothetical protein